MIIVCQNCSARLQVDETKAAGPTFSVRCPKCNSAIELSSASPASDKGALAVGGSPSTDQHRFEQPTPAPLFEVESGRTGDESESSKLEKLAQLLAGLLSQNADSIEKPAGLSNRRRKALVCTAEEHRAAIALQLAESSYQVFVAEDTKQAVERMRENQMNVVVLDPQFDPVEQGAAFVMREVNVLRPAQRRRIFFVLLSPSLRTMDAHAAFLNNINAIVNFKEIADLPRILDHSLREYNELYKDLNTALKLPAV
jgi:predicted Zn finger-like uncharacterized protein